MGLDFGHFLRLSMGLLKSVGEEEKVEDEMLSMEVVPPRFSKKQF